MIRVAGVVLDEKKHISIALRKIFGIGKFKSLYICKKVEISPSTKVEDLKEETILKIQQLVSNFEIEGNLRTRIRMNIKRLKDIKCYKGMRHKSNLPVRGQRTKTNARTRKRSKKTLKG
ncbi:MAG TPA: 30S ribosomal protein S13 [Candidatus Azoamicus sp.]